jgi:hypothetical protein
MRAPETEGTGSAGHSFVTGQLELLQQGPMSVPRDHDLGLDLLVQMRDERRFDAGLLLGAQVKSGRAGLSGSAGTGRHQGGKYFSEPVKDERGEVTGWWLRVADSRHLDTWNRHALPVIVILHDLDTQLSHWAPVRAEEMHRTGQSFKIFVPRGQILDHGHLPALLKVAASKRQNLSWEGSAWRHDGRTVAFGDRLRHALLVPRLVAPHRNTGHTREIGPEEGLALLAQARVSDIDFFADQHPSVPSLDSAAASSSWLWRLVGALAAALLEEDPGPARELAGAAPGPAGHAAATVIAVCALIEREELPQALELLDNVLEDDACEPTDHAWLLVQRSRIRADLDDRAGATADAAAARLALLTAPQDPTASALAAAAAEAVFRAADWNTRDIQDYITTNDTAVSWWRMQSLSSAYDHAADRMFDSWADRNVSYGPVGHPAHNELLAARWNASLCANVGSWRACGSLFARQLLLDSSALDGEDKATEVASALQILQASGDADALGHAIDQVAASGPLEPLRQAVAAVPVAFWSPRTFRGNLALWHSAGDLLETDGADNAVAHCLDLLHDPARVPAAVQETLAVARAVLEAVAGLLPSAGDSTHQRVRDFLIDGSPWTSVKARDPLVAVILRLRAAGVLADAGDRDRWRGAAESYDDPGSSIRLAMLARIADSDEQARAALTTQAENGDGYALRLVGNLRDLAENAARHAIRHLAGNVAQALDRLVREGWSSSGGPGIARALTELNLTHPRHAQWTPLIELLGAPQATDGYKRQLCFDLASNEQRLPAQVRSKLTALVATRMTDGDTPPDAGIVWLAATLDLLTSRQQTQWVVRLLTGITQHRLQAVVLMQLLHRPEDSLALTGLLADPNADVRTAAARECALRTVRDPEDLAAAEGAAHAAQHSSVTMALAVANVLANNPTPPSPADTTLATSGGRTATDSMLALLRNHPSSRVRHLANLADDHHPPTAPPVVPVEQT